MSERQAADVEATPQPKAEPLEEFVLELAARNRREPYRLSREDAVKLSS